jgi:hypothetical protein
LEISFGFPCLLSFVCVKVSQSFVWELSQPATGGLIS